MPRNAALQVETAAAVAAPLISVRSLTVDFFTARGRFTALHGISFDVRPGSVLGIVGESGSGKSVTALAMMRLLPDHTARITGGQILFQGTDLAHAAERDLRRLRGRDMAMIFQDPTTSLNPIFSIGHQLREGLALHLGLGRAAADRRAEELLALVRISSPRACLAKFPHELSGGMRQRVMIAIALACNPKLLIADEPTTALDVTTQAQILELLRDLQGELGMAIILITHDLGVVAEFADEVQVMYAGRIVERAPVADIFAVPSHPYTGGLLHSMPSLEEEDPALLPTIAGMVASPFAMPPGCAFHPRCHLAGADCTRAVPPLARVGAGHDSACIRTAHV
ncbi:ABC transporter ATP-binding protein [Plastoroseomonas arctica]|uniref:ABC transporter ATP-binding protein n=1 Tax=Plastoroseomonas arctica TaxID=1509237 RepID=A0AAF1K1T1_9PROT|nr:ABC transporter ATP-binding protein [Plastoroseomonas arctica]MBR0654864.1 ABC transporter ATP-binding protein [Plastoroseomonas arctica]